MANINRFPGNGLLVVRSELNALVISMKRSNRWSSAAVLDEHNRLLTSLNYFRENLLVFDNLDQLRCNDFLRPFLDVISSEDTDGTATSVALGSLNKFLTYGLIDFTTKSAAENIANAVINAKFVGADQASDGVALAGVIQVLRNLIYSNGGVHLDDELICKSISIFIRVCFETRHNETLKKLTETCLKDVLHLLFTRFNSYDVTSSSTETIRELFRSLISLCNVKDKEKNEYMIHMGLSLLKVIFENSADVFAQFPTFLDLIKDDLCKNLLALINHERLSIFALNLQVSYLMFESLRKHLKFQFESFLQKLLNLYETEAMAPASSASTSKISNSHREIALDMLVQIWRTPGFLTELYYNYDCDLHSSNLFQNIFELFSKILDGNSSAAGNGNLSASLSMNGVSALIESIECHCVVKNHPDSNAPRLVSISKSCRQHSDSSFIPDRSQIAYIRTIKKLLPEGVQLFNQKPTKGIKFLQENAYLKIEDDAEEIAHFLRETPGLDKKSIGDYISARENIQILQAYVKTFDFANLKIDESLRMYVETFRLPGESALIYSTLEQFAEHWHKCNGEPFANADAAFTLAYSIIMLNIDQHNLNVRKQQPPMSLAKFKNMLIDANGGHAFEDQMLDDIYQSIKTNEIIMPCERDGAIKENYLWKILLKQTESIKGRYVYVKNGTFDYEMLSVILTNHVDNLTVIFNRTNDSKTCANIVNQLERLARILSSYELYDELDRLLINVCNFFRIAPTANPMRNHYQYAMILGENEKLQISLKAIFRLVQAHICFVRESWKHILDIVKLLFQLKLLPDALVESDDFIEPAIKKTLLNSDGGGDAAAGAGQNTSISDGETTTTTTTMATSKPEMSFLNSFYLYMLSENVSKTPNADEQRLIDEAKQLVETNVRFEQILNDTKFLQFDSLNWLVRLLIDLSATSSLEINDNNQIDGDCEVKAFFLELLIRVLIQNRDRILPIWNSIHDHFCSIIVFNSKLNRFLFERSIIGLLKLAINLMRNEEMSTIVLQSLQILFLVKPNLLLENSKQISFGLYELLKTSAQNIHSIGDWSLVFTMLEMFGAGVQLCPADTAAGTAGSSAATSADDDIETAVQSDDESAVSRPKNGWILVESPDESPKQSPSLFVSSNKTIVHHDPYSMSKCCECLIFLVRDVAHITPFNYPSCLECIRCFVEAAAFFSNRVFSVLQKQQSAHTSVDNSSDLQYYEQISIQLLDLIFTLYTRTLQIYEWWQKESVEEIPKISYWSQGWSPLLQAICRLCCDFNNKIRLNAISFLQRTLLFQDMMEMKPNEWTECFQQILYPLLAKLLDLAHEMIEFRPMEESMIRAITLTSKIFLLNLTSLQQTSTDSFHTIWLTLLDYMHKFMYVNDSAELLFEAVPECLKNMLLVMKSARLLDDQSDGSLWQITWTQIDRFIPHLKIEFNDANQPKKRSDLMVTVAAAAAAGDGELVESPAMIADQQQDDASLTETAANNNSDSSVTASALPTEPQHEKNTKEIVAVTAETAETIAATASTNEKQVEIESKSSLLPSSSSPVKKILDQMPPIESV